MSTSHYASRPHRAQTPPPNTRRFTTAKLGIIGALLLVDLFACIGSTNLVESCAFAALVIVNLWVLTSTRL